jgi:hypothetical protein
MIYEGIRYTQQYLIVPFYLAVAVNGSQLLIFEEVYLDFMIFYAAGGLYYGYLRWKYGEINFDATYTLGPYSVGCTTTTTPKGNFCVIYYPIDKERGFLTGIARHLSYHAPGGPNSERLNEMGKAYNWKKSGFKLCEPLSEFNKMFIKQEMFV